MTAGIVEAVIVAATVAEVLRRRALILAVHRDTYRPRHAR